VTVRKDPVKVMSVLYDIPEDDLNGERNLKILDSLEHASYFVWNEYLDRNLKMDSITIKGKKITIPKELGNYSIGQAIQCRALLSRAETYDEVIARAAAIYLQPIVTGLPFSMSLIKPIEEELLVMPVTEVLPVGFFFYAQLNRYGNPLMRIWNLLRYLGLSRTMQLLRRQGLELLSL
jgi:hypothetical protein